jgi:hypothetical protein
MLTNTDKLVMAIKSLRPTAEFSIVGGDYSTITWDVLEGEAPTKKEIDAAIIEIEKTETAKEAALIDTKQAVLEKLGLTAEEVAALLA